MKKQNLLIALLVLTIIVVALNTLTRIPINVNRKCVNTTETYSVDAAKINAKWCVKYKAPLILPEYEKEMIERRIEIYMKVRLISFTIGFNAKELFEMSKDIETVETLFNSKDILKELGKFSPDLLRNIDNIKSVKLLEFKLEKMVEDKFKIFDTPQQAITELYK